VATLIVRSPDGLERRVALSRRITSVGRDAENDVAVADPSLPATALHIHFDGRDWDAAAHDGAPMTVNGRSRGTWRLGPGDRIRVGATELLFDPALTLKELITHRTDALHLYNSSLSRRPGAMTRISGIGLWPAYLATCARA